MSATVRRTATVPDGLEQARLAAVRRYDVLDTPPDGAFDRVAALAARAFGVQMATVTIVDEDRVWFKALHGVAGVSEIPREGGLCASAVLQNEPYVVEDTLKDALAVTNPLVRGELGLRFYAAAPITTSEGFRLGLVNVLDTSPREVTPEETDTLRALAAIVMDELELRMASMRAIALERELRSSKEAEMHVALESHASIDQAVGILMKVQGCDAATAWDILKGLSQNTDTKLSGIAEATIGLASGADTAALDDTVRQRLRNALTPQRPGS